jgi:signal transduction histidine kinase
MTTKLCILGCHNFHQEVGAGVTAEGWNDVVVVAFPARCGRPPVNWDELRPMVPADCGQVVVLGRACLKDLGEPPAGFPPTRVVPVAQCFHLVAGEALVNEAIAGGAYLITSAWLADWRGQLKTMGFAPEQAGEFFQDFARELVLLDTGLDPDATARLAELQETTKLPARRIAVGLDTVRLRLSRLVLEWRLAAAQDATKEQARRHAGELADYVAAMDMLVQLAKTQNEAEAIVTIEDLFRMLFAPAALYYLPVENTIPISRDPIPAGMDAALRSLRDDYAWTPNGDGFLLRIGRGEEVLGLVAVDRLAFPSYRERYLNMALAVTGICGLAIENARNRKKLLEAEKMASLGILVAGVAHEINTPLGVGLVASSSLQKQSRQLAQRFAARSMSQSDLEQYLESAESSTDLVRRNLERIGHLVDTFRQVAVDGIPLEKQTFRLKECLDDVIRSLGDRLPKEHIEVSIACDPELEVESVRSDWVSIFVNLIGNSLKHGFREREKGRIEIHIASDRKRLRVDYHDDGVGLAPKALARIFDPFFTTDLQHGMGLGMHLVYNLITHRMDGSIQCASQPGEGVRFHIDIPLAPRHEEAS